MANDSTTVTLGSNVGILGKIGTVVDMGEISAWISFDGGASWQKIDTMFNCGPGGACFVNGLGTPTLETKKTVTGSLVGGEINVPVFSLPFLQQALASAAPFLRGTTVGFQYLHFDGGHVTATRGTPSQIQITADQKVAYDSFKARFALPLGSAPSDIRLKRDIAPLRRLDNGLELYRFRYLWSDTAYVGVMAQEVERVRPDAVMRGADGYLRVNYDALGLKFQTYEEWSAAEAK
jgi:hypothetical protein